MNSVDNNSDHVAMLIKDAATTFQPSAELKNSVRKRIMGIDIANDEDTQSKSLPHRRRLLFRSWRMASAASLAIIATSAIVGLLFWPTSLTMAQVQEAVEAVPWIHVQYDNGDEQWISPSKRIWAVSWASGSVFFTDYQTGIQHSYHGPHNKQISVRQLEPWKSARSAWDVIVGYLEERVDEPGGEGRFQAERHSEIVDGHRLVRFDSYIIDALDQRTLVKQIWVDTKTRLPVKVRRRLHYGERKNQNLEQKFITGTYTFPDSGPGSIYDLGVQKELIVVKPDSSEPVKEVSELMDAIRVAERNFLENYKVIVWQNERASEIDVLHFNGLPKLKQRTNGSNWLDFSGVKIRQAHYFNHGSEHPQYHLPLPTTTVKIHVWSLTQTPVELSLSDGERTYSQTGPMPSMYKDAEDASVIVRRVQGKPLFAKTNWPTEYQWPTAHRVFGSPLETLETTPGDPPDTIGLRTTYGNHRYDFFIDPNRDNICIKQILWERRDNDWFKQREVTLDELVQLPSGHWVATKRHVYTGGSPDRNIRSNLSTWLIHLEELDPQNIPPETFDGELLLNKARKLGATIETY